MLWQVLSKEHARWPAFDLSNQQACMDVPEPTQRVGHSFTALPDGRFLFFGGWDGSKLTNDAYFYTPATGQWAQIMPGPEESHVMAPQADTIFWPQPLAWHTANLVVDDDRHWRLVVFGGKDATDVTGNALELKIKILSEKEIALLRAPSEGKTAEEKYLEKQKEINNTRKEFSPLVPKLSWSKIDFAHQKSPHYQHPTSRPADRMQHTGTSYDRSKIVYLGGQGRSGRRLGDMWELNTRSWRWRQIRIRGWPPSSGHSSVLISPGVLLVFGGETAQDTPAEPELWHIRFGKSREVQILDAEPAQLEAERPSGDTQEEDEVEAAIAHGDVGPYGDLAQTTLRPPGRALFTFTEIEIEPVHDWHGDQSSGLERCPPDLHPTMDAKYFNGKELHMRDPWSRDLNPQELFKKDWSQQYEHNRRFLLMGGFGKGGVGCQDMWELRLYTQGLSFTVCEEGSTFSLPPGTCGKVEEAFYGQRTSFIDVTELLQSLVREDYSLEDVLVENESFGIIDRHEDLPEKRWRDHVEEWTREVGNQDPLPGVDKKLVVKYHKPPGSSERYKWSKIPPSPAPRSGSALKPVIGYEPNLGDSAPAATVAAPLGGRSFQAAVWPSREQSAGLKTAADVDEVVNGVLVRQADKLLAVQKERADKGEGGGPSVGQPPVRGGHCAAYVPETFAGVGGVVVVGGAERTFMSPSYMFGSAVGGSALRGRISNPAASAGMLLMVVCPKCACPLVELPRRYCIEKTCKECALYCPLEGLYNW